MTRKSLCVLALLPVWLAVGCASGESVVRPGFDFSTIDKVAVIEVTGAIRGETAKNAIADYFAMELMRRGYIPVERHQVQALLEEQDFQRSDLTSNAGAAAAGRILNVPAVLIVNVPTYKEEMAFTAKMILVEDAGMLWIGSGEGTTGRTLSTIAGAGIGAGAGILLGGSRSGRIVGGVAGGVLGGAAGYALSAQQATQAKKIIHKMCMDMPRR